VKIKFDFFLNRIIIVIIIVIFFFTSSRQIETIVFQATVLDQNNTYLDWDVLEIAHKAPSNLFQTLWL